MIGKQLSHLRLDAKLDRGESGRRPLAMLITLAAAGRVAYLLFYRSDPLSVHLLHDARRYHDWAIALATGQIWEAGPYYQAPLYPWLLGLLYRIVGPEPLAMYVVQSLAGLATIALIYRVGRRIAGLRVGLVAAALATFYGVFLFHETKLLPGSVAALLAVLAVERVQAADAAAGKLAWLPAGAVIGVASLLNPTALVFAGFCLVWLVADRSRAWKQRLTRAAVLGAGVALFVAPVTLRNVWAGNDTVLISANGGVTFYQGNNPTALGVFSVPPGFQGSIFTQRAESHRLAEEETGRGAMRDSEVSRFWFGKGLAFLRNEPGRGLWLLGRKLGFAFDNHELPLEYHAGLDRNPVRRFAPLPFALILGLVAARYLGRPAFPRLELPLVLQAVSVLATLLIFYPAGRYRLPAMPALLILAGSGAVLLWSRFRARGVSIGAPAFIGICAAALSLLLMPAVAAPVYRFSSAIGHCDLAAAHLSSGRPSDSADLYREASRLAPLYPYAELGLGRALIEIGDRSGAEDALRRGIALDPGLFQGHFDLGVLLYDGGRLPEAADEFLRASRIDPSNADAGNNLLGTLVRLGRRRQAEEVQRDMRTKGLPVDPQLADWLRRRPQATP